MLKLNPYPYLAAVIVLAALYASHRGIVAYEVGVAKKGTQTSMENTYKGMLLAANVKAKLTEDDLKLRALALEGSKDAKIKSIDTQLAVALSELRKRPKRPTSTDTPQTPSDIKACTGGELYQEDAEFLTRESARADQVVVERNYYYEQYETARKTLDGFAK
jgi:hypothetical protein